MWQIRSALVILMSLLASESAPGASRIFLDFNSDGNLNTIVSESALPVDTVTVILELRSSLASGSIEFALRADCGEFGHDPEITIADGVYLNPIPESCNAEIFESCGGGWHVCNHSCGCRPNTVAGLFRADLALPWGLRYPLFKLVANRGHPSLENWAYLELMEDGQPTGITTNEIFMTWVTPVRVSSWGELKRRFRAQ